MDAASGATVSSWRPVPATNWLQAEEEGPAQAGTKVVWPVFLYLAAASANRLLQGQSPHWSAQ